MFAVCSQAISMTRKQTQRDIIVYNNRCFHYVLSWTTAYESENQLKTNGPVGKPNEKRTVCSGSNIATMTVNEIREVDGDVRRKLVPLAQQTGPVARSSWVSCDFFFFGLNTFVRRNYSLSTSTLETF